MKFADYFELTRYGHRGSKGFQAYTFFKTLYETKFILKVSSKYTPKFLLIYLKN